MVSSAFPASYLVISQSYLGGGHLLAGSWLPHPLFWARRDNLQQHNPVWCYYIGLGIDFSPCVSAPFSAFPLCVLRWEKQNHRNVLKGVNWPFSVGFCLNHRCLKIHLIYSKPSCRAWSKSQIQSGCMQAKRYI